MKEHGEPKSMADIGAYLHMIKEAEPRFTGRAIKNVTDAIKMRAMDIELPDEWFAKPEAFMHKGYDEKKAMIEELRGPFSMDMVMQEINRYADSRVPLFRQVGRCGGDEDAARRQAARARDARDGGAEGEGVVECLRAAPASFSPWGEGGSARSAERMRGVPARSSVNTPHPPSPFERSVRHLLPRGEKE